MCFSGPEAVNVTLNLEEIGYDVKYTGIQCPEVCVFAKRGILNTRCIFLH